MKIIILSLMAVILACACLKEQTDTKLMTHMCEVQRENPYKDFLAKLVCSDRKNEALKLFSIEEIMLIFKILDETPNEDANAFMQSLADYPTLAEKVRCFQAMAIYDTRDPDVLGSCTAYRSAFD